MLRSSILISVLITCIIWPQHPSSAQQNAPGTDAVRIATAQNATIGLITGEVGSTDAHIAADLAAALNDGERLRVLPMLGGGSVQNIADLIYQKGVDVAIVHADALTETLQRGTIPRESSVQYIAKLFQEEIHILARQDIASVNDLNDKLVSIGQIGSGTALTASTLLDLSHVTPKIINDNQLVSLDRLRHGDISAMFLVGGKPVPLLQAIESGSGLHFLPIPLNTQLVNMYLPTKLDHQHYPNLVPSGPPIDTVAVGSVLVTLATPSDTLRAKRVNRFVDTLFERFDALRQPGFHPKWQEVNLAAQIEGWTRYPEAQSLLEKEPPTNPDLHTAFETYLHQTGQKLSAINPARREALFQNFLRWREQHSGP